ncbi:MAG: hypothetical protein ABSF84_08510 [Acidimicrobiales bacterium]
MIGATTAGGSSIATSVSIAMGIVSIIVGMLAMWLSWKFYQAGLTAQHLGDESLRALNNALFEVNERSRTIGGDITQLREETFTLLSKGFNELLSDRIRPEPVAIRNIESDLATQLGKQFGELRDELVDRLGNSVETVRKSPIEVEAAVSRAVQESIGSVLESQRDALSVTIIERLEDANGSMVVGSLMAVLMSEYPMSLITQQIRDLIQKGELELDSDRLHADAIVSVPNR